MATKEARQSELKRIHERDGGVKASVVVRESKPKEAPLHDEFEWNDDVAGPLYRLHQARRIIRITPIRTETGAEHRLVHVPAKVVSDSPTAVLTEREGVYRPVHEVVRVETDYQKALHQLMAQRNAMDKAIRDLQRAAKRDKKSPKLLKQLIDALEIAKSTLHLMEQDIST